jgi:hypothetical protein
MIASLLGPTNANRAEHLADDITERLTRQCDIPVGPYAAW